MSQWIEYLSEPKRLTLTWEPPKDVEGRTRWIVGELTRTSNGSSYRYLVGDEFLEANNGRTEQQLKDAGYFGYPAFDRRHGEIEFSDHVLEAFLRRLPPNGRADFADYLRHFRIPSSDPVSPFALLGATEARLPGDGFSLVDPFDAEQECCDAVIEVAGHRHYPEGRTDLLPTQEVKLIPQPDHPHDSHAVRIDANGRTIGYVNRVQAPTISHWLAEREVHASLLRLNGSSDQPRAFVFVSVRPSIGSKAA